MAYEPEKHNRQSPRLNGFDHSKSGYYFITICTNNSECLFGKIVGGEYVINRAGKRILKCYLDLKETFFKIKCHEKIVMPNHFHCIIEIFNNELIHDVEVPLVGIHDKPFDKTMNKSPSTIEKGQPQGIALTIGEVIGAFKSITTNEYLLGIKHFKWKPFQQRLWQRNYSEQIIRDEIELRKFQEYIRNNPSNWQDDEYNPENREK